MMFNDSPQQLHAARLACKANYAEKIGIQKLEWQVCLTVTHTQAHTHAHIRCSVVLTPDSQAMWTYAADRVDRLEGCFPSPFNVDVFLQQLQVSFSAQRN